MREFDAIVVGASVAGAATACRLGRAGYGVLLLDRAVFPRSKVCGEGLMPAGVALLGDLGIDAKTLPGREFRGIRFQVGSHPALELDFLELSPRRRGLAVSRESLDDRLLRQAARLSTVELRQGFNVGSCRRVGSGVEIGGGPTGERFRARVLVAADGIRSRFHRWEGIERTGGSGGRFALRALFRDFDRSEDWVDVFCGRAGEAYIAPLDHRSARVTLLLNRRLQRLSAQSMKSWFNAHVQAFPEVVKRISGPPERVDATAPVSREVGRCHGDRLLLVGDAAGAIDPITGQGMTLALRDSMLAARLLEDRLETDRLGEPDLRPYTQQRAQYFAQATELSRRLLTLLKHPWLVDRLRRALANNHSLRSRLLASAVNPGPSSGLSWSDRLRLVAGF